MHAQRVFRILTTVALAAGLAAAGSAPAQAATMVGTDVHVAEYCTWKYGAASFAFNIGNTWDGWRCSLMSATYSVDMNRACSLAYGAGAYAQNPSMTWNGWRCYR
ncbi:hypothetical protein [Cellulomonas sp.]|uniref:hypothetical protein n=1 Tax=Cellulomonas sp. TaxID=40001 RepID=UPI001AFD3F30|nr:hypothetical protein [Cellulomonas sp.]MBO9556829.1 hypothetical protein [Cellulomonas sp.]